MLADAGVLEARKDGRIVRYHVRYEEVSTSLRSLAEAFELCRPDANGCSCGC
jgi:hypothetical protein